MLTGLLLVDKFTSAASNLVAGLSYDGLTMEPDATPTPRLSHVLDGSASATYEPGVAPLFARFASRTDVTLRKAMFRRI